MHHRSQVGEENQVWANGDVNTIHPVVRLQTNLSEEDKVFIYFLILFNYILHGHVCVLECFGAVI